MPKQFTEDMLDWGFNIRPALDQQEKDIREALRLAIARKRANPDYFQKQMDGVLPPRPIVSPEHYHLSYEYLGYTYPYTDKRYDRSRMAYLELWRLASLSRGDPVYWDDGAISFWTTIKGRTGKHQICARVVECFLANCGRDPVVLTPHVDPGDGQNYDREIGPTPKRVEEGV